MEQPRKDGAAPEGWWIAMLVRDVMTKPAYHLPVEAPPRTALEMMARVSVTSLPVVDGSQQLVGIVSEADLLSRPLQSDPRSRPRGPRLLGEPLPDTVAGLMTRDPYAVQERDDVAEAVRVMVAQGWKSIPVVSGRVLVGMLSRSDVIRALARSDEEIRTELTDTFARLGSPAWRVEVHDGVVTVEETADEGERRLATWLASEVRGVRAVNAWVTWPSAASQGHSADGQRRTS